MAAPTYAEAYNNLGVLQVRAGGEGGGDKAGLRRVCLWLGVVVAVRQLVAGVRSGCG